MKLGIYGGSFSPVHIGHFKSALHFYDHCKLDKLLIMPVSVPPHKAASHIAPGHLRMQMLKEAFSSEKIGERNIEVSDFELLKEGKSYTYLTLEHFAQGGDELYLLMGSDMFLTLDQWKNPDIICDLATIVLNPRETDQPLAAFEEKKKQYIKQYGARVILCDYEPLEASSSDIRAMIERGTPTKGLLDADVLHVIKEHKLYGSASHPDTIKKELPALLSAKRCAHVLSVEREVMRMAELFALDEEQTLILRRGALLHDITHEKSFEEQLMLFELYGVELTEDDQKSPAVLHQVTGALVALDRYGVSAQCANAIACHTTGKAEMTLIEKLLCLADYIEETRTYPACKELRRVFYEEMPAEQKETHLDRCMLIYYENTVRHLEKKGAFVHPQTMDALEFMKKQCITERN